MARMLETGGFWTSPLFHQLLHGWGPQEAASEKRIGVLTVHVGGECRYRMPSEAGLRPTPELLGRRKKHLLRAAAT